MTVQEAVLLGILQGLTEFLPISSSGHLILVPWLLGWSEPGLAFSVSLHLGTLLAVFAYFWRDLWSLLQGSVRGLTQRRILADPESRLGWAILLGTLPAGVVGILANDHLDHFFHSGGGGERAIAASAGLLILVGLLLLEAERVASHRRHLTEVRLHDGWWMGVAQAFALLPGVSRSGSTIIAGLLLGFERATAARFSFLLGIPAMLGAGLLEGVQLWRQGFPPEEQVTFLVGTVSATITGFLAIAFLLRFLQRYSVRVFVWYRLLFAIFILFMLIWR